MLSYKKILLLIFAVGIIAACTKPPTSEACHAAIVHMMEVQLDSPEFRKLQEQVAAPGPDGQSIAVEQMRQGTEWLKSQIPSLVTPDFVAQCVQRMKSEDVQCTMNATTVDDLINKCHWKVVQGPRGNTLGF